MLSNRQAFEQQEENPEETQEQSSGPMPWSTMENGNSLQVKRIRQADMSDLSTDAGSFQLFHKRSKALMTRGVEIQEAIRENRNLRASFQKQLFRAYGEMSQVNTSTEQCKINSALIMEIKEKINHLDDEHTLLNKQFVCVQSRVLQTVKNQRNRLVKGSVRTA